MFLNSIKYCKLNRINSKVKLLVQSRQLTQSSINKPPDNSVEGETHFGYQTIKESEKETKGK